MRPDHADGLPSRLAIDLAILRGDVVGIVEHVQRSVEADAVLLPVEPILPCVPGKFHGTVSNGKCVYTLRESSRKCKWEIILLSISACFGTFLGMRFDQPFRQQHHPEDLCPFRNDVPHDLAPLGFGIHVSV